MRILIIGSGGREHAIARALAREPHAHDLHAAPGNPGVARLATCHPVPVSELDALEELAARLGPDLVVVGPEAPLVAGLADRLTGAGLTVFGPSRAAAALEGSKSFAKDVMAAAAVPTATAHSCTTPQEVEAALAATGDGTPFVVKADGLAAGKGVVVTSSRADARAHAASCLALPGARVVVEDFLDGPEVSLFCLADGATVVPLAPAQDFKRALDGDRGANTGGMGAYSPVPWLPAGTVETIVEQVAQPVLDELARRGTPFRGLLYCGLALTAAGVRVVEFNARFGDPETQVVLERLESPLSEALYAAATGTLAALPPLRWRDDAAVTVVLASAGYPASSRSGDPITGLDAAEAAGCAVLHSGTAAGPDGPVTAGGRVLCVVGTGADLPAAREHAYHGVAALGFDGAQHRTDIAARAADGAITAPQEA